jgi:hypothetical protein
MRMSTLTAAAVAFAAYKYLNRQRTQPANSLQGMQDDLEQDLGLGTGMGTGAESSQAADRMQPTGGVAPRSAATDKLFGSSSQQGSEPISTGLPDLTRGS